MNIKTSIVALFLFFGVSFSVSATQYYQVIDTSHSQYISQVSCSTSVGAIISEKFCAGGGTYYKESTKQTYSFSTIMKNGVWSMDSSAGGYTFVVAVKYSTCPIGQKPDSGGNCYDPCEGDGTYDDALGVCVNDDIPYCEQQSTKDAIFSAEQSCAAQKGEFSFQCHNGNDLAAPSLETSCGEAPPDTCIMGFANWPECLSDYNPTDPIDPPDGGFVNPGSSNGNSPDPSFNKPEPDPVTPNETTDTVVLQAIQNMNRDNNQALSHINKDINKGNADIKNKLDDVKNSTNAVGQSIVDQMNQDYQIAQQNRQAISDQNMIIGKAAKSASDAVVSSVGDLKDEVGFQGTRINDTLNGIADKICDPRLPDANCEGDHGLGNSTVTDIVFDVAEASDKASDKAYLGVVSAAQGYVNDSGTGEIQSVITSNIDSFMNVFPNSGSCSPLSLPTPQGEVFIDCEFSDKAKTLISFLLYVYTAWTLISILLSGITPVPNQQPNNNG